MLANWTTGNQKLGVAATEQLEYLLTHAPRSSNGLISQRVSQVQAWADAVYMFPPFRTFLTRHRSYALLGTDPSRYARSRVLWCLAERLLSPIRIIQTSQALSGDPSGPQGLWTMETHTAWYQAGRQSVGNWEWLGCNGDDESITDYCR